MREIIKEPDKLLREKCETVDNFDEAKQIVEELLIIVKSVSKWWNRWLGFAANQIGHSKRIIILRKGGNKYQAFINPILTEKRFPFLYIETCYSLNPKRYYLVRYLWSKIKYQDLDGDWQKEILKGPSAVYQEVDHIEGILLSEVGLRIF